MELLLIRHALPIRLQTSDGSPADPPLSERGRAQAASLARWLADEQIDRIYTSPLRRAHQTALSLAESKGLEIELEPRVAEYDRDDPLYIPLEELKQCDYELWRDFVQRGYPEGLDLEQFNRGVLEGIEEIIRVNPGKRVAVVCHGGVINAWTAHVLGLEFRLFFGPGYTSINRFLAAGSGERSLESLNETAHLRGI